MSVPGHSLFYAPADTRYPESDGKPMADSPLQFEWILRLYTGLAYLFSSRPDVLVVCDLLWYPVQGRPDLTTAPDVMVVLGRPQGHRRSYKQWEEGGIPPHTVFEILSESKRDAEMARKIQFFARYGVSRAYLIDPWGPGFSVWQREGDFLIPETASEHWQDPELGFELRLQEGRLNAFDPAGNAFLSPVEIRRREEAERAAKEQALAEAACLRALLDASRPSTP
jgi:Uma2 family endonuclease